MSEASDTLTIDLAQKLNICDYSETCQKQTAHEANEQNQIINIHENTPFVSEKMSQNIGNHGTSVATCTIENYKRNMSDEQPWEEGSHWAKTETCVQPGYRTSPGKNDFKATGNESVLNANALTFKSTENSTGPSIGQDLWKQLKRVQIPVFSGDKRTYQSWMAAFLACIDSAPATCEYSYCSLGNT